MPVPSPRNSIRIARGNFSDLNANVSDIGEGELCFALDQDKFYSKVGSSLVEVGKGTAISTLGQLGDVDVASATSGQVLSWDGTNWVAVNASGGGGGAVDSVNGQTGVVVIDADDIDDSATTHKFATAAQLGLADTSVQPSDNISTLTNDAGYITTADLTEIDTNVDDLVTLSGVAENSTDLGTFTGDTITDNTTVKNALQEIETALEGYIPVLVDVHNDTGSTIAKGQSVYISGTHSSGKPTIALADANGAGTFPSIGLTNESIANGVEGFVVISGYLDNVDTSSYSAGAAIYLSETPGAVTTTRPSASSTQVQKVGLVTRVHATSGSILVIGAGRTNDVPNELTALTGVALDATDLGTFTGATIADSETIKGALQDLETALELKADTSSLATVATSGAYADLSGTPTALSQFTNDTNYITSAGAPVQDVAGKTGSVTLVKGDVGLGNVDNTSDANKPISTATQTALDAKADLIGGVLDTAQLPDIAVSEYKGAVADQTAMLAVSGEKGDWVIRNDDSKVYVITGTDPTLVGDWTALSYPTGFSGAYADLTGKPTLGTAAATDSTDYATAAQGTLADSATQPGDNISTLTNDAGYITSADGGDATTLDGVNSTQFLRSDSEDIKTSGNLRFNDNVRIGFGNSSAEGELFSDGSNVFMELGTAKDFRIFTGVTDIYTFANNGDFTASGDVTAFSDINLKENIEVIPDALDKVSQLRGVTYDRKDKECPRQSGVIAQEVEAVLPEVVHTNEDGIKSVAYGNLVGLLIESIKELKAEVEQLKQERN